MALPRKNIIHKSKQNLRSDKNKIKFLTCTGMQNELKTWIFPHIFFHISKFYTLILL